MAGLEEDVDMDSEKAEGKELSSKASEVAEAVEAGQGESARQAEYRQAQRLCDEMCLRLLDAHGFMTPRTRGWSVEQLR